MPLCFLIIQQQASRDNTRFIIRSVTNYPAPISVSGLINTVIVGAVEDLGRLKRVFKRTDVSKIDPLAGSTDRASLTCRTGPLKINLHRPTREAGERGQIGSKLLRFDNYLDIGGIVKGLPRRASPSSQ